MNLLFIVMIALLGIAVGALIVGFVVYGYGIEENENVVSKDDKTILNETNKHYQKFYMLGQICADKTVLYNEMPESCIRSFK